MGKIGNTNGFGAPAALRIAASDPRVAEIEGGGMEEGRVSINLAPGYWYAKRHTSSRSVGSASDVNDALAEIAPNGGPSTFDLEDFEARR